MSEPNLRERIIEAVGRDTAINMRTNKGTVLPYEIVDLSGAEPVVISSWADYDEAHEQMYYAIASRRADAALSALLSSPITEEEVEAVVTAMNNARLFPRPEPPGDYMHKLARAAIIAYRTVIGRKG